MNTRNVLMTVMVVFLFCAFITASYAEDAQTLYIGGIKKVKDRDFEGAIKDFGAAIKANKSYVKAYVGRGMCYFMLDNHQKAIADLNEAIQLDPENVTALFWRGSSYLMAGDSKSAIPDYSGVLKKQPENAYSYLFRGIAYFRLDKLEEAISDVSKSISYNPRKAEPYVIRGLCYYKKEMYDSTVRDFKRGVELEPANAYYHLLAYVAQAKNGDASTGDLGKFYNQKDARQDRIIYQFIGMMLGKEEPEDCLKAAQNFEPSNLRATMVQQAQFFVANYFFIKGNKDKGKEYLDKAMNGENKLFVIQMIVKMIFYDLKGNLEA